MTIEPHRWVIVLAAGDQTLLPSLPAYLTGRSISKPDSAPGDARSLLLKTLDHAKQLVPPERILTVVAAQHRQWWEPELKDIPPPNVVVQPRNRGTAADVLLAALVIDHRDPEAEIMIMPSGFSVNRGEIFASALEEALLEASPPQNRIVLQGMTPEEVVQDYGWILPHRSQRSDALKKVAAFVDQPDTRFARDLVRRGALINTLLLTAPSRSLLKLYRQLPDVLRAFRSIVRSQPDTLDGDALAQLYENIPVLDFSRGLLESSKQRLWVFPIPACGWSDLGTPGRVEAYLRTLTPEDHELSRYSEML